MCVLLPNMPTAVHQRGANCGVAATTTHFALLTTWCAVRSPSLPLSSTTPPYPPVIFSIRTGITHNAPIFVFWCVLTFQGVWPSFLFFCVLWWKISVLAPVTHLTAPATAVPDPVTRLTTPVTGLTARVTAEVFLCMSWVLIMVSPSVIGLILSVFQLFCRNWTKSINRFSTALPAWGQITWN